MSKPTILVVEDNPISLRLYCRTLEAEGYGVLSAVDAQTALVQMLQRPDIVVQDLILPDMDGLVLCHKLRALPGGADIPFIAISGFLSKMQEALAIGSEFTAVMIKPVEPLKLLEAIRPYVVLPDSAGGKRGQGKTLLLVDSDAVQRKLNRIRLEQAGFKVLTAEDGDHAFAILKTTPVDVLVKDILTSKMNSFNLCRRVRLEPALRQLPIVLISSHYFEDLDLNLAEEAGASAIVPKPYNFEAIVTAILESLAKPPLPMSTVFQVKHQSRHADRIVKRLQHQLVLNSRLAEEFTLQAAQLSLLAGVADALTHNRDIDATLHEMFAAALDAAGLNKGALYLLDEDGKLRLRIALGYDTASPDGMANFFGEMAYLEAVVTSRLPVALSRETILPGDVGERLFEPAGVQSGHLMPLVIGKQGVGVIFLGSGANGVNQEYALAFARGMATQITQSLTLAKAFSELAQTQSQMARSQTQLQYRLADSPVAIYSLKQAGPTYLITWTSENITQLLGYSVAEATSPGWWESHLHPNDRDRVLAEFSKQQKVGYGVTEYRFNQGDGSYLWLRDERRIVRGVATDTCEYVGSWSDVTPYKHLEEQFLQAQKMEVIGRLSGSIAHDFNNLLTVITGYSDVLLRIIKGEAPTLEPIRQIRLAADRASSLTKQLLAFSRNQVLSAAPHDLNTILKKVEPMIRRVVGEDVELLIHLGTQKESSRVDQGQIDQVLLNLVVNARDAMPKGGRLTIETGDLQLDKAHLARHPDVAIGRYNFIAVADTGCGMDAETKRRVFEPFFTTKDSDKGTGLGLPTVYGIVKQSGGHIEIESEPGKGSVFRIFLPQIVDNPVATTPATAPQSAAGGTETILIVEDEAQLRSLIASTLATSGYHVLSAGDGDEALKVAADYPGAIALVITDVVMAHLSGREMVEKIQKVRPEVRVLFMSGYTDDAVVSHGIFADRVTFSQKPFTLTSLLVKVREKLDTKRKA